MALTMQPPTNPQLPTKLVNTPASSLPNTLTTITTPSNHPSPHWPKLLSHTSTAASNPHTAWNCVWVQKGRVGESLNPNNTCL
jgi:hypothetical protein